AVARLDAQCLQRSGEFERVVEELAIGELEAAVDDPDAIGKDRRCAMKKRRRCQGLEIETGLHRLSPRLFRIPEVVRTGRKNTPVEMRIRRAGRLDLSLAGCFANPARHSLSTRAGEVLSRSLARSPIGRPAARWIADC